MSICGSHFSESVPELVVKSLFNKYDTDGSRSLQRDELMVLLKEDLGLDEQQAETVIMVVDKDGSGDVSFREFLQWLRDKDGLSMVNDSPKYQKLRKAVEDFKKFDKDGSGTIEPHEFKQLWNSGEYKGSMETALKTLDKDGDGKISFPEFLAFFTKD